ncbi:MAG: substrate-binding domain-containing protein [Spirochaetaceae bacterium]|jgi:ribose transport system substrate-binding protein|nr:substrate-binding domain-containing protein [Spirochaetaceae bacterium]
MTLKKFLPSGIVFFALLSLGAFTGSFRLLRQMYALSRESGGAEQPARAWNFALFLPDYRSPFFLDIIQGAQKAAEELNADLSIHSVDPAKKELEMAVWSGFDGVIVCPYFEESLARKQLEKLREYHIPVVLINLNLAGGSPWPYVGTSNYEIGRSVGTAAAQASPGTVRPAVVYSDKAPGIDSGRGRLEQGIASVLGDRLAAPVLPLRTDLNPLDVEDTLRRFFASRAGAEEAAVNTLVFTNTTDTAAAAETLALLNGTDGAGPVTVIGFGSAPGIEDAIRRGVLVCTIVTNPVQIGGEALRSLEALRRTGYTSMSINTQISIIDAASFTR